MTAAARGKAARTKGNTAEQACAAFLTARGWPTKTSRNSGRGAGRQSLHGDLVIAAAPHAVIDVKARKQPAVADWLAQLALEAQGEPCKALWIKRDGYANPADWLVIAYDWPLGAWENAFGHVRASVYGPLHKRALTGVNGWHDIEARGGDEWPALNWHAEGTDWLLMRGDTFAECLLGLWEGT